MRGGVDEPLAAAVRGEPARLRRALTVGFAVAVTLSGLQLAWQTAGEGGSGLFGVFVANLVASLPWLPLAFGIAALTRRCPPRGPRGLCVHAGASLAVGLVFLAWLAGFHTVVGEAPAGTPLAEEYAFWLRSDLAEFGTVVLLVYWLIVAACCAVRGEARTCASERVGASTAGGEPRSSAPQRLVVRRRGKERWIDPAEIEWIEAQGDYARLHLDGESELLRASMAELARRLAGEGFARIHRSTIVRLDRVAEVRPLSHGEAAVTLASGRTVKASRTYREALGPATA